LKPGYINGASRRTLQTLTNYPGATGDLRKSLAADTNCLIAATHFLPLFLISDNEEYLVQESINTVYISHKNKDPLLAAEFLSRTLYQMIYHDKELQPALEYAALKTNHPHIDKWLRDAIEKVNETKDPSSDISKEEFVDDVAITSMARLWDVGKSEPIKIGKASPTEGALPASLYFALKYSYNVEEALIANAGCGGDSAARGMVIGMLLGAQKSFAGFDREHRWVKGLNSYNKVNLLINNILSMKEFISLEYSNAHEEL